ncbi:MAG TPA: DsbC family protein [Burkholderiales bacterium]|nr:DsbC family protein [Burkholderiales bacterium]
MPRLLLALLILAVAGAVHADDAQIRRVIEAQIDGAKVEGIEAAPLGLYEVRVRTARGVQVVYSDANAEHLFIGRIYDTKAERDITTERLRKLNAVKFDQLPFEQAVKIQRGNGQRVFAMFSDPHCPYCRQFEQTLQKMDDITLYIFMFPVIRPDLADHSKAVWCSADRGKAWVDLALNGKVPPAKPSCPNPVEKNVELGQRLGVSATPTLIFTNGERVSGLLQVTDLNEELEKTAKR